MALASLSDLKLLIGVADTDDDTALQLALDAASDQVEAYAGRRFVEDGSPVARVYFATGTTSVDIDPITSTAGLVVKTDDNDDGVFETTWTLDTDYRLEPINAAADGKPFDRIVSLGTKAFPLTTYHPAIQVTATGGYAADVPAPIRQATLLQAERLYLRKNAPFGVAGSPDLGNELRLLAKLDPDVEALVRPYRRSWWVI